MKQTIKIIIFSLIFAFFAAGISFAAKEDCFIQFDIKETKTKKSEIVFSFLGLENLYGQYDSLVRPYFEESASDYILRTYGAETNKLNEYGLNSARFVFWDGEDEQGMPTGGVEELKEGTITAFIPYDKNIAKITIDNKGKETDLGVKAEDLKCERTCKIENEKVDLRKEERCCLDFTPASQKNGSYICVTCGDNVCSQQEDQYSCYKDCGPKPSPSPEPQKPKKPSLLDKIRSIFNLKEGKGNLIILVIFFVILIVIILAIKIAWQSRKRNIINKI